MTLTTANVFKKPHSLPNRRNCIAMGIAVIVSSYVFLAPVANAGSKFNSTLGAQYAYLSNVYSLPSNGSSIVTPSGQASRGDHTIDLFAGFNEDIDFGRQLFSLDARFNHLKYVLFTQLDHNEYTADAILKWKAGHIFDGTLGYTQEQSMVSFTELADPQLAPTSTVLLETSKVVTVNFNVQLAPTWRLESRAIVSKKQAPRPADPDLELKENTGKLAIRNLSRAHLSFGVDTTYVDGKYENSILGGNPDYKQSSYQLVADYVVSGLTTINAAAGYTKRTQNGRVANGNGDVSAFTGLLGYRRVITPKTDVELNISRSVNSYVSNVSSEIDSGVTLAANWKATAKIATGLNFGWTSSDFPNEFVASTTNTRLDHSQFVALELKYQVLRTFRIKPYARYEDRDSSISYLTYHGKTFGIELSGSWQ